MRFELLGYTVSWRQTLGIWDLNTFGLPLKMGFVLQTSSFALSLPKLRVLLRRNWEPSLLTTSLKWAVGWLLILQLQWSYLPPPTPSPLPATHSSDQLTWGCIRGLFSLCLSPYHGGEAGVLISPRAMWAGVLPLVGLTMLDCWSMRDQTQNRPFRSGVGQPSL